MKYVYMTMAAVSALAVAAPVAAQPWSGNRSNSAELQMHLDGGMQSGAITRREAMPLRTSLNELIRMERSFGRNGFNRSERNTLELRSASLHRMILRAERNGNRTAIAFDRNDSRDEGRDFAESDFRGKDGKDDSIGTDRRDTPGDRFAGDLRVGQRFSDRQVALPMQYRARYRDSDASFYRYDDERIYQIDRSSGLIMAMFDIGR